MTVGNDVHADQHIASGNTQHSPSAPSILLQTNICISSIYQVYDILYPYQYIIMLYHYIEIEKLHLF